MAITQITMKNLNDMNVVNAEANLKYGFFWVEFENGKSLQCCLRGTWTEEGFQGFHKQVEIGNSGFDEGVCWDCNEWAADEDGEVKHIEDFLLEQAKIAGLEII